HRSAEAPSAGGPWSAHDALMRRERSTAARCSRRLRESEERPGFGSAGANEDAQLGPLRRRLQLEDEVVSGLLARCELERDACLLRRRRRAPLRLAGSL